MGPFRAIPCPWNLSRIVWDSVAFWVHGGIWQKYIDIGGPQACCWGYPVSNEISGTNGPTGSGFIYTWFEGGIVLVNVPAFATYETHGVIWSAYFNSGGPGSSRCGLPSSDVLPWISGTIIQAYEEGAIYTTTGGGTVIDC